ncbi:MAG: hypothetical protein WBA31_03820 [Candidatus Dormiibacterota bacterium]
MSEQSVDPRRRLEEVDARLAAIAPEETRDFWGYYRWLGYAIAIFLSMVGLAFLLRHTVVGLGILGLGFLGFVLCLARYIVLLHRAWPVTIERQRLKQEQYRLRKRIRRM